MDILLVGLERQQTSYFPLAMVESILFESPFPDVPTLGSRGTVEVSATRTSGICSYFVLGSRLEWSRLDRLPGPFGRSLVESQRRGTALGLLGYLRYSKVSPSTGGYPLFPVGPSW